MSSFTVDLILLFPLLNFIFVPFFRGAQSAALLDMKSSAATYLTAGSVFLILAYILVTTLSLYLLEATPGQKILKLKTKGERVGIQPTFARLLLRQSVFVASFALLGIPFLGVWMDSRFRTWPDKLSDTVVISPRRKFRRMRLAVDGPNFPVLAFRVCMIMIFVTLAYWSGAFLVKNTSREVSLEVTGCEELMGEPTHERLDQALTLYAASVVDEDCLDQEANYALLNGGNLPAIYLAKAFSQSENSEISDAYLTQVCSEDHQNSKACRFAGLIEGWQEWMSNAPSEERIQKINAVNTPYALVWGIRQFQSKLWFQDAITLIDILPDEVSLAEFKQRNKIKSLWGLHQHDEVRRLFASAGLWAPSLRDEFAEKICEVDLSSKGCEKKPHVSCAHLLRFSLKKDRLSEARSGLVLKALSCPVHRELALAVEWSDKLHPELLALWSSVKDWHRGDRQRAEMKLASAGGADRGALALEILDVIKNPSMELDQKGSRLPSSHSQREEAR